jgi:hypothetical protein
MKTKICIFFLFFALIFSCNAGNKNTDYINIDTIINSKLYPILDSIIIHESHCDYYTPNLMFSINLDPRNNYVLIGSIGLKVYKKENILGCFEYRNHLFFIKGPHLDCSIFKNTGKKKSYIFAKSQTHYDKKEDVFIIDSDGIQDDSFSYWYYEYKNNDFTYYSSSSYCDR